MLGARMLQAVAGGQSSTKYVALPLTYDETDANSVMTWVRQGSGPHVTPSGFEGDGYEARLKSTTIPSWMQPASAAMTMHASVSFYPQEIKSSSEFAVYLGQDDASPIAKLILSVVQDATNSKITQLALRGGTDATGATFAEKLLGRSGWKFQFRSPDLLINGFESRPQAALFLDANTLIVSAHFEDTVTRVWKINPATAEVLGSFDCTGDWVHIGLMARRSNGEVWVAGAAQKICKVDLDASFTAGTMQFSNVISHPTFQVGGIEFVTVSTTEYLVLVEYLTSGAPYFYVFPATVLAGTTLAATDRYKRFTGAALETQGCCIRSGKLITSSNASMGTGATERWGHVHQVDIITAISSTADEGAISGEDRWDYASKYSEDITVHPTTNDLWGGTEGITAVGSDDGGLSFWSSPLDDSLVENHYTCEYDGAGTTTIKVNNRIYDTMPGTLVIDVACATVGGSPTATAGMTTGYFTGYVRNVVFQDTIMSTAQYNAAINGDHEPNNLTAYTFTLTNPGAESGNTTGWTAESGGIAALDHPGSTATTPHSGTWIFNGGSSATSINRQRLDVLAQTGLTGTQVDAGGIWAKARWWQANFNSIDDSGGMGLRALDATSTQLTEAYSGIAITPNSSGSYRPFYPRCFAADLASGTRHLDSLIKTVRSSGTNNDSYFDDISVTVYQQ